MKTILIEQLLIKVTTKLTERVMAGSNFLYSATSTIDMKVIIGRTAEQSVPLKALNSDEAKLKA
ncbi:hypothetical protein [Pedobacter hartonius]|nr:hypothetical protein [Pedobacter hartonius]